MFNKPATNRIPSCSYPPPRAILHYLLRAPVCDFLPQARIAHETTYILFLATFPGGFRSISNSECASRFR